MTMDAAEKHEAAESTQITSHKTVMRRSAGKFCTVSRVPDSPMRVTLTRPVSIFFQSARRRQPNRPARALRASLRRSWIKP